METTKKPSDKEILKNILHALDINGKELSKKLDMRTPGTVYHILSGRNNISRKMRKKILEEFPNVNYAYIAMGEEPILTDDEQHQKNMFYNRDNEDTLLLKEISLLLKEQNLLIKEFLTKNQ